MNDRRQLLFDAVLARLRTVRVANGYASDLGARIFAWRDLQASAFEAAELPAAILRDPRRESVLVTTAQHQHTLHLEIQIVCEAGTPDIPMRTLLADVEKAIGTDTRWLVDDHPLAISTLPSDDQMTVQQKDQTLAGATYRFAIEYRTESFNPYTPAP